MSKINIHLGDCMNAMKSMKNNQYDLSIVDVPYGIGESKKNRNGITKNIDKRNGRVSYVKAEHKIKNWDSKSPDKHYFEQLQRVSKNQMIFGANHFIENIPNANSSSWVVWDKCNGTSDFADCELVWTSFKSAVRQFRFMWSGMFQGKQSLKEGHIFEGNLSLHEKRIHKTHKPVIIYKWLLKNYGFNKDGSKRTIFDSHGGSMSIVIACIDMGFDIDIWEIDPDYYKDGVNRVKRHLDQLDLTRETVEINIK